MDDQDAVKAFFGADSIVKISFIRALLRVKFDSPEAAKKALEKSGGTLKDREVVVEFELRKKKGKKTSSGKAAEGVSGGGGIGRRRTTAEEEDEEAAAAPAPRHRVYVGGLNKDSTEESVIALFKGTTVVSAEIIAPDATRPVREGIPTPTHYAFGESLLHLDSLGFHPTRC